MPRQFAPDPPHAADEKVLPPRCLQRRRAARPPPDPARARTACRPAKRSARRRSTPGCPARSRATWVATTPRYRRWRCATTETRDRSPWPSPGSQPQPAGSGPVPGDVVRALGEDAQLERSTPRPRAASRLTRRNRPNGVCACRSAKTMRAPGPACATNESNATWSSTPAWESRGRANNAAIADRRRWRRERRRVRIASRATCHVIRQVRAGIELGNAARGAAAGASRTPSSSSTARPCMSASVMSTAVRPGPPRHDQAALGGHRADMSTERSPTDNAGATSAVVARQQRGARLDRRIHQSRRQDESVSAAEPPIHDSAASRASHSSSKPAKLGAESDSATVERIELGSRGMAIGRLSDRIRIDSRHRRRRSEHRAATAPPLPPPSATMCRPGRRPRHDSIRTDTPSAATRIVCSQATSRRPVTPRLAAGWRPGAAISRKIEACNTGTPPMTWSRTTGSSAVKRWVTGARRHRRMRAARRRRQRRSPRRPMDGCPRTSTRAAARCAASRPDMRPVRRGARQIGVGKRLRQSRRPRQITASRRTVACRYDPAVRCDAASADGRRHERKAMIEMAAPERQRRGHIGKAGGRHQLPAATPPSAAARRFKAWSSRADSSSS